MRWAFCLMLFPAVHATAQETKTTPDTTPGTTSDASAVSDAAAAATTPQMTPAKAPMFPDSLMLNYEVQLFQNVLKMADLASFKYTDAIAKAKAGDAVSIYKLLDFHRVVDGVDALNHAVSCLELIPLAGDRPFAEGVSRCPPALKKVVLDRLILAQGRTKKTFLRQNMTQWAPFSWAYLNGQAIQTETPPPAAGTVPGPSSTVPVSTFPASTTPTPTKRQ